MVENTTTNKLFAHKILFTRDIETIEKMKEEFLRVKNLTHKHLLKYHELFIDTMEGKVHLIMDYFAGKSLDSYIKGSNALPENVLRNIFKKILNVTAYLHLNGVVHRDIKPENILIKPATLFSKAEVKLIDFSVAAFLDVEQINSTISHDCLMSDRTGTMAYRAPETFNQMEYTEAVDVWAIGCTLFECTLGRRLVEKGNITQLIKDKEMKSINSALLEHSKNRSKNLIDLIEKLLHVDPKQRITCAEALTHKWFVINQDMINASLTCAKRYSCLDIMTVYETSIEFPCGRLRLKSFS